jgi:mannose-6-phosphate isomerase-like protein (cupin superfamily)
MSEVERQQAWVMQAEAAQVLEPPAGMLSVPVFARGSLDIRWYAPVGEDRQSPHPRDEVYVVARGRARFFDGSAHHDLEPGACLFVAAGQIHRFEAMSADFAVWVMFYGPEGGETASSSDPANANTR